ncbi:unnamed protein product [Brachionus calyciflorus]|uniref:PDZ domain-containing protein n=1 Tax=Brachionus calyciflorus TaxID=104777 RepID=A0A813QJU9_9BILA|nr:unnamed protein product [Brachionus calyciflorus]
MPSWKPDCLKASHTLNHINNTIQTARLLHDENLSVSNESTVSKTNTCHDSNSNNNLIKLDSPHSTKSEQSSKALSFQNASSKVSIQKGYSLVELSRINGSQFGLTIAGGTDKDSRPRICDLKPGSIAHRCDELQIGDMIISINNIKTQGLKHEEIIDLIKNAGDSLRLEFEYNLPPWPIHPHHAVRSNTVHIQLEKENNSYGFTIRGGYNEDQIKSRPLIVTNIRAGGPSDREGTLKIGDRILAINGINVVNATLQDAYYILKQCKGLTLFLVEYDSAIVDSIKNSNGPLLIEIEKSPGSAIGIKLCVGKSLNGKNQILVESVKPASIADRCGAIYVGDQILSIDDVSFEHVTLAEANQILKNCVGEFSRVEILPLSQMHASKSFSQIKRYNQSLIDFNKDNRLIDMKKFGSINSCSTPLNTNSVCHSDVADLILKSDENGTFGFTLQSPSVLMSTSHISDAIQNMSLFPVIGYVEPNSPAEKSGIIQPGDRILSVNGRSLEGLSLEEARQIIKESGMTLHLEIEFDVADSIMLSSGIFQVKLLKKNLDLGVSVAYPKYWKSENYPFISEIKKGSVAYRSGMLQQGDQILFIDNYSLRNKTLGEVNQLLRSADEIVKLKIKKDDSFSEENSDDKSIVYTVEMQRNGGPLGITISGSDDIFEPMYVSGLSEGGLAERTNAIHVGDVILAINNVSLRGKSLTEAIELLQNADDMVTLKISRKLDKSIRGDESMSNIHASNQLKTLQAFKIPVCRDTNDNGSYISNQSNNEHNKSLQYLPFPLDMTNFIRQSQNQSTSQNSITNNTRIKINNQYLESLKKKANSLDSINAVERELDEVLKDLELNSQDLNEQLEENEFHSNSIIELPITIQKNIKIETCSSSSNSSSSPSTSLNKSNNSNNSTKWASEFTDSNLNRQVKNSEFLRENPNDLFIDDLIVQTKSRHNIISTYELCTECFDENMANDRSKNNVNHKCCKNRQFQHLNDYSHNKSSSPINFLKENNKQLPQQHNITTSTTVYNQQVNPIKISNSFSNQDISQISNAFMNSNNNEYHQQNRLRSIMDQTNEPSFHDIVNNNKNKQANFNRLNSSNRSLNGSDFRPNGNVISQRVFSIGLPNGTIRSGEHSPSPKSTDSRKDDDKLDKLPPVPPSTWSANASFRRRNQVFQSSPHTSNNRIKKTNVINGSKNSFHNEMSDNFRDDCTEADSPSDNKLNIYKNNIELTIRESEEEDDTASSLSNSLKNYDNVNQNEDNIEDEKLEITINKDNINNDFGFSIIDSIHGNGIFVHRIRNGTNAEQNFFLRPKTKIFKINNYDFTKIDINQALKILSSEQAISSNLKLVISKKPKNVMLNEDKKTQHLDEKLNSIQNPYAINSSRATAL